jgi:hypothetical protein
VIKYLLILIILVATFWHMQFSSSLESDGTKLMESIKNLKLDNNTIIAINPTFTDDKIPIVSSFLPFSSSKEGINLISTISVPNNHLLSSHYGNTYSPFKPCIIDTSSPAFSTSATYQINGRAKIVNPSENGNYTLDSQWLRLDLSSDTSNKVKGYLSFGDIRANINFNPIITQCFNYKDFKDGSPSSVIAAGAAQINPPFNSCPVGYEISYSISAQVQNKKQVITIRDPNDMSFNLNVNSDFRTGELRTTVSLPGIYDTININSISTTCKIMS